MFMYCLLLTFYNSLVRIESCFCSGRCYKCVTLSGRVRMRSTGSTVPGSFVKYIPAVCLPGQECQGHLCSTVVLRSIMCFNIRMCRLVVETLRCMHVTGERGQYLRCCTVPPGSRSRGISDIHGIP